MLFAATISLAFSMMEDMSTPITCLAPALTANLVGAIVSHKAGRVGAFNTYMDKMAVPQPTSRTTLSLKM